MSLLKEIIQAQEERVAEGGVEARIKEWPVLRAEFEELKTQLIKRCKNEQHQAMLELSQRLMVGTFAGPVTVFVGPE